MWASFFFLNIPSTTYMILVIWVDFASFCLILNPFKRFLQTRGLRSASPIQRLFGLFKGGASVEALRLMRFLRLLRLHKMANLAVAWSWAEGKEPEVDKSIQSWMALFKSIIMQRRAVWGHFWRSGL